MSTQRYLVTARKYRPQLFSELVAQEHVTGTLKNAIRLDRLAHAYLFSGPRGVGKTTAARILAKAINCTTPAEDRVDAAEPCRQCDSCRSFEEGRNLNIIEIDAASNNKVEDIRDLRETVRVPPQGNRKKVYIVDEVHMLSNAAFNALLKTLEEPPPYVLFIFATTEPNRVLPTILSRCQRFDFRRIAVPEITSRLEDICGEENITADEASLMLIARKGDGALRDALSAFDQAVSLCGTDLHYPELAQALGVVDVDLFFDVTTHVEAGSAAGMLGLVEQLVRAGYDLQEFLAGLAEHLRNLLVARTMPDTSLIEAPEATRRRYAETARAFSEADLLRLLAVADETETAIKNSSQPRLKLEMALLKMTALPRAADLRVALERLERLERMAREGKLPAEPTPPPQAQAAPPPANAPSANAPSANAPRHPAPYPAPAPALSRAPQPPSPPSPTGGAHAVVPDDVPDDGPLAVEPAEPPRRTSTIHRLHPQPDRPASRPPEPLDEDLENARDAQEAQDAQEARDTQEVQDAQEARDAQEVQDDAQDDAQEAEDAQPSPRPRTEPPSEAHPPARPPQAAPSLFGPPALPLSKKQPPRDAAPKNEPEALFAGSGALATRPAAVASPALQRLFTLWPRYVQAVKTDRIHVGALLQHGKPTHLEADALLVAVPDTFHQRLLDNQHDFLLKHFTSLGGGAVARLEFVVHEDVVVPTETEEPQDVDPAAYMQQKRQENPVIRALFDQFGGELVW